MKGPVYYINNILSSISPFLTIRFPHLKMSRRDNKSATDCSNVVCAYNRQSHGDKWSPFSETIVLRWNRWQQPQIFSRCLRFKWFKYDHRHSSR